MDERMGRQAHCRSPFAQVTRNCCSCNLCWSRSSSLHHERFPGDADVWQSLKPCVPHEHSSPLYSPRTFIPDGTPVAHKAFPASTWTSPSRFNQKKCQEQKKWTMEPPSMNRCGACGAKPNQITLHSWYLVRCVGCSNNVEVSVGGFIGLFRPAGFEKFETGAIVQRLGKCRLLAQDGVEVRLSGLIDDATTVSNGFSVNLAQSFLVGFPYTWNYLLDDGFHMSSTNGWDHQVLGDCGLGAGAEMSQPSFEGCCLDQGKKGPSVSQKEVSYDHLETCNDVELNTKQSTTEGGQTEKESKSLSTQAVLKDNEGSYTGIVKCDKLKASKVTVTIEQDIFDSSNTTMEGLQAKALIDQSQCNVKKKLGRKPDLHCNKKQGDDADAGSRLTATLNQSPHNTRSSCKISRHAASNGEQEDVRPRVDSKLCSFSSSLIQESVGKGGHSARRLAKQNNSDKVDGCKVLNTSPCNSLGGVETPVEIEVQRPERSLNAEASWNSRDDSAIIQAENMVTEALPVKVCNTDAKKEDSHMFSEISDGVATPLLKRYPKNHMKVKKSNEEEGSISSRSSRKCSKRAIILPPLPCPRVPITKELISTAFGLKTSRSGRLLVPPLAHWCGQSLLRDIDGGIIAISDGSKDKSNDLFGSFKFKPPAGKHLQKLQKRLCEAATGRNLFKKKKIC